MMDDSLRRANDRDGARDLTFVHEALHARANKIEFRRVEISGVQERRCNEDKRKTETDDPRGSHVSHSGCAGSHAYPIPRTCRVQGGEESPHNSAGSLLVDYGGTRIADISTFSRNG